LKMRRFVACLCIAFAVTAFSQAEDLNKTILDNETRVWNTFLGVHPDVDVFAQLVVPNYLCIESTGELLTKADNINQLNHLTFSSFKIQNPQVRQLSSNAALIVARVRFVGKAGQQDISNETLTSTVWVKQNGKWLAQLHTETYAK
jgi:hypothetical protein